MSKKKPVAAVDEIASVTCIVGEYWPVAEGVPVISPPLLPVQAGAGSTSEEHKVSPFGRVPAVMDQLYGGTPPEASTVAL